ncbi:MAG: NADH-quinone oxidoreductase subunit L [Bdellovibrionales bacterium]|nr:NADH-quinone oxidoreductase subunit L [Bdellovibrionales bacterium]
MNHAILILTLLIAPLLGFAFNGLRFRSHNAYLAGSVATAASFISFLCSLALFFQLKDLPPEARHLTSRFFDWIVVGDLRVPFGFTVDQISAIMILIITGVGSLIHLFSIGYMSHDERPSKYFAYLNLFLFNMLVLVLGDNLLITFVGWEGVGLCSYLLIGFWFSDPAKAAAGMKAFVTNRIGDAGFLIGMFILFFTYGTLTYSDLLQLIPQVVESTWTGPLTLAFLFLFIGATGKSAQIPLYVWLPDAMAGPTPVSALIHAATMVTAGVYLFVRLSPALIFAPHAMEVIAWTGAATALVAATIGITQWDIKKILAYSTVSQLGYMFLAVGVGAFGAAQFHLMTHAFFKALMFLGSGSVIHAMHEEQDVRKMGGLRKYLPITHFTFVLGWLAIIGIPPFAGFFSKDEILWQAFSSPHGSKALWFVGALTAACTAFYMTRLMALTFWGKSRFGKDVHPHESPPSMTIPLMVLGLLSVIGGWVGIPHVLGAVLPGHPSNLFEGWLKPVIGHVAHHEPNVIMEWALMGVSVSLAGLGAWFAYHNYLVQPNLPKAVAAKLGPVYRAVANKYYVDEFYDRFLINPLIATSKAIWLYIDVNVIDKVTYFAGDLVSGLASFAKTVQNGKTQSYALYMALGVAIIMTFVMWRG